MGSRVSRVSEVSWVSRVSRVSEVSEFSRVSRVSKVFRVSRVSKIPKVSRVYRASVCSRVSRVSKASRVSKVSRVRYLRLSLRAQCVAASPPGAERLSIHLASPLAVQEANGKRVAAAKIEGAARIGKCFAKGFREGFEAKSCFAMWAKVSKV